MTSRGLIHTTLLVVLMTPPALAQGLNVEARAAAVTGRAIVMSGAGLPGFELTRGYVLNPGDQVDTRGGGRVVIDLSDGSMVIVQPESVVVLKDYRSAGSARELFDITLGRVRVKINHFGGRPNPYRMNSPTASIAVRGTEFGISVTNDGSTQVVVFEGAVEVTSLTDPGRKVLIEAGRGVLIQAGQDFRMLTPQNNRDFDHDEDQNKHAANNPHNAPPLPPPPASGAVPGSPPSNEPAEQSPRASAGTYERYISGLADIGEIPFLLRFNAFPESHLDSLENPAYATTFTRAEGRLFILPSMSGVQGLEQNLGMAPIGTQPVNYSISPQLTMFAPIPGSRFVVGGSVTASSLGSGVQPSSQDYDPGVLGQTENYHDLRTSGSNTSTFFSGSVLAARRFGSDGRTSLGLEIESLKGTGSIQSTTVDADALGQVSHESIDSRSDILQNRFTVGLTRDLFTDHKLGVFYRYTLIDANDGDVSHVLNSTPLGLDSTRTSGHSDEIGLRLRGPLTRRLFYGVEAGWLNLSLADRLKNSLAVDSHQQDRASRGTVGLGVGYVLGLRTILSFDLSGGVDRNTANRFADLTGGLLQTGFGHNHFIALHTAIQTDITRRLFVSTSLLSVWQDHDLKYNVWPDQAGNIVPVGTPLFPSTPTPYQPKGHYSDYGVGWRFSPNLFAQYVFSTDYGYSQPSHTLMLRYTFHFHDE